MDADPDGLRRMARFFASHGVTAWLPSTMTASGPATERALEAVAAAAGPVDGGATILGAYLEGPYPPGPGRGPGPRPHPAGRPRRGGPAARPGVARVLVLAPEFREEPLADRRGRRPGRDRVRRPHRRHLRPGPPGRAGRRPPRHPRLQRHAPARPPRAQAARGGSGRPRACELIADNVHVHPAAMRLLVQAKGPDGVVLVSDALRAAGLPEGAYTVGDRPAFSMDGAIRLADGTLAGSVPPPSTGRSTTSRPPPAGRWPSCGRRPAATPPRPSASTTSRAAWSRARTPTWSCSTRPCGWWSPWPRARSSTAPTTSSVPPNQPSAVPAQGGRPMPSGRRHRLTAALTLALALVLGVAACGEPRRTATRSAPRPARAPSPSG